MTLVATKGVIRSGAIPVLVFKHCFTCSVLLIILCILIYKFKCTFIYIFLSFTFLQDYPSGTKDQFNYIHIPAGMILERSWKSVQVSTIAPF